MVLAHLEAGGCEGDAENDLPPCAPELASDLKRRYDARMSLLWLERKRIARAGKRYLPRSTRRGNATMSPLANEEECDAGIAGGCGACEKCDPEWWAELAKKDKDREESEKVDP